MPSIVLQWFIKKDLISKAKFSTFKCMFCNHLVVWRYNGTDKTITATCKHVAVSLPLMAGSRSATARSQLPSWKKLQQTKRAATKRNQTKSGLWTVWNSARWRWQLHAIRSVCDNVAVIINRAATIQTLLVVEFIQKFSSSSTSSDAVT